MRVWITWHDHPRSRGLAAAFGAELRIYSRRMAGGLRHVEGTIATAFWLARDRPREIFVQNSFLLLLVCAAYRTLAFGRVRILVADCHNKSLKRRMTGRFASLFWRSKQWSFRKVDLVLVSNSSLLADALHLARKAMPLIDPVPRIEVTAHPVTVDASAKRYVLFVCSHESDEPSQTIADVARELVTDGTAAVVVTGRVPMDSPIALLKDHPDVHLPGFVPRNEYESLMWHAGAVVVLTRDEDCLCCGAYESISCGRPTVLIDHEIARSVFGAAARYVSPGTASICAGLRTILTPQPGACPGVGPSGLALHERFETELQAIRAALDPL